MRAYLPYAEAAPATVSGELSPNEPLIAVPLIANGKAGESVRAASQETCRHMSPIVRAGRAEERTPVVATDADPIEGGISVHGTELEASMHIVDGLITALLPVCADGWRWSSS